MEVYALTNANEESNCFMMEGKPMVLPFFLLLVSDIWIGYGDVIQQEMLKCRIPMMGPD